MKLEEQEQCKIKRDAYVEYCKRENHHPTMAELESLAEEHGIVYSSDPTRSVQTHISR
jgi:hypothetical protein